MPAKDRFHDVVVRALQKNGWTIRSEQVSFLIGRRYIWIDIQAYKDTEVATTLVEVKGFRKRSQVENLMEAVGKYVVYRAVIDDAGGEQLPLYLAVPKQAYNGILSETIGKVIRKQINMKLLVVDTGNEEAITWIT